MSLFSSNFHVDYEGYDIFELWTLSGKLYLLSIEIILARQLRPWVSYPTHKPASESEYMYRPATIFWSKSLRFLKM